MRCPRCEYESPSGMKFCGQCATPLAAACAACGAVNPPGHRFCGQCAAPLASDLRVTVASPDTYTPRHLAEKILTSKGALEGERKQVTVLFADVKGSMELLGDRDPEETRKLLDPVLTLMMEAVHQYEGTVNQVMGDGIMALFGAPLAHEDHAVRACYAALRMQDAARRYSDGLRRAQGMELQIRVGVNSGDVVVRSIGSDLRMDYSAVGQTTNLAARMEQLAAPGSIRLTAGTVRLAEGFVQVTPLGPVPIKGLPEPIEVFELAGAGAARTRLEAAARRGLTRFVGRTRGAGPATRRPRPGEPGARPGGRGGRRAGGGQVAPLLGAHPLPSRARLVHRAVRLGVVRQGHRLPAGDRAPPRLLRDRGPRRPAEDPGEGHRQGSDARTGARAGRPRLPGASRRAGRRAVLACPRSGPAASADARRGEAAAAPRERGATSGGGLRGPALDRRRRPRACSMASSRACPRRASCSSSTTVRNTRTPGAARPTTASSGSILCRRRAPRSCSRRSWARTRRWARSSGSWSSERRPIPSSSRRACGPSRKRRPWSANAAPIASLGRSRV